MAEILIGDHNWQQHAQDPVVDGERKARGCIPRDYNLYPPLYSSKSKAFDMPLIPRSEWPERIRDMTATQSRLSDIRKTGNYGQPIPSRDQNGKGYCWAHSSVSAALLIRARDGQPYVDLSAYAIACIIKNYRDEGGWGALSLDWIIENGIPTSRTWPQQSMSRSNDTPEMRAEAKLHRFTEEWMENAAPYDRNATFDQLGTALLLRVPGVADYNWWSHSVDPCDLVDGSAERSTTRAESGKLAAMTEFELIWGMNDPVAAGFGVRIWNSWGDGWSDQGMGVLTGSKAIPDGCVIPRVMTASNN